MVQTGRSCMLKLVMEMGAKLDRLGWWRILSVVWRCLVGLEYCRGIERANDGRCKAAYKIGWRKFVVVWRVIKSDGEAAGEWL